MQLTNSAQFRTVGQMSTPKTWPVEVKNGNATIKIHKEERVKKGRPYIGYRLIYYAPNGKRRFESFADYKEADRRAHNIAVSITKGDAKTLTLTADALLVYHRAMEAIKGLDIPLDIAAGEYAQAKKLLGAKSMIEAARYINRTCADLKPGTVRHVVDEFIALRVQRTKRGRPASPRYLTDLRHRLGRFADCFHCEISNIRPEMVEQFLTEENLKGRTRFNFTRVIKTLFRYAVVKRYFPRDVDPLEGIETIYQDDGEILVFSPEELTKLFAACRPEMIPFLAIGAFSGIRSAEIMRLNWKDIHLDIPDPHIEVKAVNAKTRSRRLVPIQPCLKAWLQPHRKPEGPVCNYERADKQCFFVLAPAAGVKWLRNGLRHSYITYRMEILKDEGKVALEAGNSPQMVFQHYRALTTDAQAHAWFAVMPSAPANVLQMPAMAS